MSYNWNTRTELLLGADRMERLAHSHVLVVGLGGVGAYAAEQICRAGIGHMTIVDADTVNESNINRQLPALHSTLGMPKAEVVARRLLDINPRLKLGVLNEFLRDERTEEVLSATRYDFVVDAIDSLSPKVFLLYHAYQRNIPVVSSMGAGAKMDPSQVRIADISKTCNCALAKAVRKRLRGLGVNKDSGCLLYRDSQSDAVSRSGRRTMQTDNDRNRFLYAGNIRMLLSLICY